jgi:hypothetical protein
MGTTCRAIDEEMGVRLVALALKDSMRSSRSLAVSTHSNFDRSSLSRRAATADGAVVSGRGVEWTSSSTLSLPNKAFVYHK